MIDHLDRANLGECHTVIIGNTEARLREGEAIVSAIAFEARETRFFSMLSHTSEEGLEGQINTYRHILQDLRMHAAQGGTLLFQNRERVLLLKTGERDSVPFVGGLAHFQQVVIEPTTLFKGFVELLLLLLGRIETVLKHFQHISIVGQTEQECKREAAPHLPQRRNAAFIPMDK